MEVGRLFTGYPVYLLNYINVLPPGFPGDASSKEPPCQYRRQERRGFDLWVGKIPGEGHGNPLHILAWKIPRTEEPGGLQSVGSQRVGHD